MSFAFVFPGQGSQSVGMMNGYSDSPIIKQTFEEASDLIGKNLWNMAEQGPEELLSQTVNTQPLMLTAGVAVFRSWLHLGGTMPSAVAGHSLGEFSALVAAQVLSFKDALTVTQIRANAMQLAVPNGVGGMAAILGVDNDVIEIICKEASQGDILEPANFNSPGQVVIAGHKSAIERAVLVAKEKGAKRAVILPMSVPSHCSLLKEASQELASALNNVSLSMPTVALIHNVNAAQSRSEDEIKKALVSQLFSPVRWVDCIHAIAQSAVQTIYECGPGKVLAPLIKRIDANLVGVALCDSASMTQALNGEK